MIPELALLLVTGIGGVARLPGLLGQILVYPWLGLFPGYAIVTAMMPRETRALRLALGLALAPLVTCVLAWVLVDRGVSFRSAALAITIAGGAGTAIAAWWAPRRAGAPRENLPAGVFAWAAGLAAVILLVPILNPYHYVRSDAWIHGGIVEELLEHGLHPEDARMAGVRLNYVWFFNFFIALLTSLRGQDLFRFMALHNVACAFSTVVLVALIAQRLWASARVALAAAVLLTLGLNAGAFLLWPINLLRATTGKVRGWVEISRLVHGIAWHSSEILYSLNAPLTEMVSFLDKPLVGTALNIAYVQMAIYLWALLAWLSDRRWPALVLLAASAAGMMLFHSVVGLSAIPISAAVLALAWLLRSRLDWLPERGPLLAALLATILGALLTWPYLRSITAGWAPETAGFHHHFLELQPMILWTLVTACAFAIPWAVPAVRSSWRERHALPVLCGAWAAGMSLFACVVHLPQNNSVKFVLEFFLMCVVLAAPAALRAFDFFRTRRRLVGAALAALFLVPTALTLQGYLLDPGGHKREELHPIPGETTLYEWLRHATPREAVVVDANFRDVVAVRAARRLYLGTTLPADLAAFPVAEMGRRQAVMRDLYGTLASRDSSIARLRALGRPVYVIYRPNDPAPIPEPWARLAAGSGDGSVVYGADGFHVVRVAGAL